MSERLSLTRAEATERAALLRVRMTHVVLDLREADTFTSDTTITFTAERARRTFVDVAADEIGEVWLNDQLLDGVNAASGGRLVLTPRAGSNTLVVRSRSRWSTDGEGLQRSIDPADGRAYVYAMSFLDNAPRWFACFDQPDLKTGISLRVLVDPSWRVLGNGRAEELAPGDWAIRPGAPIPTYAVTVAAGEWCSVAAEEPTASGVRLAVHAPASRAAELHAQAEELLAVTAGGLAAYESRFDLPYVFGDYHQVFVPDFNAGAMENPGCVLLRSDLLFRGRATAVERRARAVVVLHELAHQWFGNLVTMRWWDDLWLNEAFAEYLAHAVGDEVLGELGWAGEVWVDFTVHRLGWGLAADQAPSSHPVARPEGDAAPHAAAALADFDGISYAKGAVALRQWERAIGTRTFLDGLNDHFGRHEYANASLADLQRSWRRAGARGVGDWVATWLRGTGPDTLRVTSGRDGARVLREASGVGVSHELTVVALRRDGSEAWRRRARVDGEETSLPETVGSSALLVVPDGLAETWAVQRWPDGPGRVALSRAPSAATRASVWTAVFDGVRHAHLDPGEALALVEQELPAEPADVIAAGVCADADVLLRGAWVAPTDRAARRRRLAAVAEAMLAGARGERRIDRALGAWRWLISWGEDEDRLTGWLAGRGLPHGLTLDPTLAWRVRSRLAVLRGDTAVLDEGLSADPSTAAHVAAAGARARIATVAAKERALSVVLTGVRADGTPVSNSEVQATASALFDPEQTEVTAAVLAPWFDRIVQTGAVRGGSALTRVIAQSYPLSHAGPAVESATLALLEADPPQAIARALADELATARCADRARRRWATASGLAS